MTARPQKWQSKKRDLFNDMKRETGPYVYSFSLPVATNKIPEILSQKLRTLAAYADELDGPVEYAYDPEEVV